MCKMFSFSFITALFCLASVSAFTTTHQQIRTPAALIIKSPTFLRNTESSDDTTNSDSSAPSESTEEIASKSESAAGAGNDILNSPAFSKRKLEVLRNDVLKIDEDIEAAKQKLDEGKAEWGSQIEDLEKEYKNIQQRMTDQSSRTDDQATMQVARQMLDVLDNFDRAFGQVTPASDEEIAIEAEYRDAYDMILTTFKKLGVEEVVSVGTEFDYEVHQAVMQKPSDEYDEGIVCEEFQKGFKIGNTLIRAAMVAVAA